MGGQNKGPGDERYNHSLVLTQKFFKKEKQFGSGDEQNCLMWGCREGRITWN